MRTYHARKEASKQQHKKTLSTSTTDSPADSDAESTSTASPTKPSFAPSQDAGFFSTLKSKIYGAPALGGGAAGGEEQQGEGGSEERANETAEAMAGPREGREGEMVGEVDELVLVCHGIGQKVSGSDEERQGGSAKLKSSRFFDSSQDRTSRSTLCTP